MINAERNIFFSYVHWHYLQGFGELVGVFGNVLWFIKNFFSFNLLTHTLFALWRRMGESYVAGFNLENLVETFIVNSLMRVVGFVSRVVVLLVGVLSYGVISLLFLLVMMLWLLLPAVLLGCAILSFTFFLI